jgi:osmotically-inducible protein OsmY
MITTIEKSDLDIKKDVLAELIFEPTVKATDIGVLVSDGTVTLNGFATSFSQKAAAIRATKRVCGVKAIADAINVHLPNTSVRSDGEIAGAAANQIDWITTIPKGAISVTLSEGWITLEGAVEWWYEKEAAENAVTRITGVRGVSNQIKIHPQAQSEDVRSTIEQAFNRSAYLDASNEIEVEVKGTEVTLTGTVRNYREREEAERIVWASGVSSVDNQLVTKWFGAF